MALRAPLRCALAGLSLALVTAGCSTSGGPSRSPAARPSPAVPATPTTGPADGLVLLVVTDTSPSKSADHTYIKRIEVVDPARGTVRRAVRWPSDVLDQRTRSFDATYTRLAAARSESVGYLTSDGRYTPVGAADMWPTPSFAYLKDRLVMVTKRGALVGVRNHTRVPGYPPMPSRTRVAGRPAGESEGIWPKTFVSTLVSTPYGTVSMLYGGCDADPSRAGGALCLRGTAPHRYAAKDASGRTVHTFAWDGRQEPCGIAPRETLFLCGEESRTHKASLYRLRPSWPAPRPVLSGIDGAVHDPIVAPGGGKVAVVVVHPEEHAAHPRDVTRPPEIRIIANGRGRTVPIRFRESDTVSLLAWH